MRAMCLVVACVLVACSGDDGADDTDGESGLDLIGTWCRPPDDEYDCTHCMTFDHEGGFEMRSTCPGSDSDAVDVGTYDADARSFIADIKPCDGGSTHILVGSYTIANDVLTFDTAVSDMVIAGSSLERVETRAVACE